MFDKIKTKVKFRHEMRKIIREERKFTREAVCRFMEETDPELAKAYLVCMKYHATREAMARKAIREA